MLRNLPAFAFLLDLIPEDGVCARIRRDFPTSVEKKNPDSTITFSWEYPRVEERGWGYSTQACETVTWYVKSNTMSLWSVAALEVAMLHELDPKPPTYTNRDLLLFLAWVLAKQHGALSLFRGWDDAKTPLESFVATLLDYDT